MPFSLNFESFRICLRFVFIMYTCRFAYIYIYIYICIKNTDGKFRRNERQTGENYKCVTKFIYDLDIKGRWRQLATQNRFEQFIVILSNTSSLTRLQWNVDQCRAITSPSPKCIPFAYCNGIR